MRTLRLAARRYSLAVAQRSRSKLAPGLRGASPAAATFEVCKGRLVLVAVRVPASGWTYTTRHAGNLNELVGQVSGSAGRVSAASQQLAATSEESGRAAGEIHSVGDIAQGAEPQTQMVEVAKRSADKVGQVSEALSWNRSRGGSGGAPGAGGRPAGYWCG